MAKKSSKAPASNGATVAPQEAGKPLPVEVKLGRLKASIWKNRTTENRLWVNVTLSRSYKDAQNEWHNSTSFGMEDLLALAELVRLTFHRAVEVFKEDRQQAQESPAPVASETDDSVPF